MSVKLCVCGEKAVKKGLCEECLYLLRAKKTKNIIVLEKFRSDYNEKHNTYKSYGQFVLLLETIDRRRKEIDNRGKKATVKKVRRNRGSN